MITDSNQAANALKTGEIDIASSITGEAVQSVRDDSKLQLMEMPGLHVAYIYFNQVNGPTADKKVREALIKAINVEEMTAAFISMVKLFRLNYLCRRDPGDTMHPMKNWYRIMIRKALRSSSQKQDIRMDLNATFIFQIQHYVKKWQLWYRLT